MSELYEPIKPSILREKKLETSCLRYGGNQNFTVNIYVLALHQEDHFFASDKKTADRRGKRLEKQKKCEASKDVHELCGVATLTVEADRM